VEKASETRDRAVYYILLLSSYGVVWAVTYQYGGRVPQICGSAQRVSGPADRSSLNHPNTHPSVPTPNPPRAFLPGLHTTRRERIRRRIPHRDDTRLRTPLHARIRRRMRHDSTRRSSLLTTRPIIFPFLVATRLNTKLWPSGTSAQPAASLQILQLHLSSPLRARLAVYRHAVAPVATPARPVDIAHCTCLHETRIRIFELSDSTSRRDHPS
jgi:hypothetical protein